MKHINVSLFVPHLGCPNTCIFCNQRTISGKCEPLQNEDIIKAAEIAKTGKYDIKNSEIAFFGGSFTAIDKDKMISYLETAKPYIGKYFGGIRISTRPDCIDSEILGVLKNYGVTAIELGAQSMCEDVLIKNERGHTPEDTKKAAALIKEYGFSLGLQMMTGLYGSNEEKDIYTAKKFIELSPDTVRIYPTVVLENTKLAELYKNGEYTPESLENAVSLCARLLLMFREKNIKVIRLGLHSGGNVEEGFVAGVFHPAFRELCETEIYKNIIEEKLSSFPKGDYLIKVAPSEISKALGHKKSNAMYFGEKGKNIKVTGDGTLSQYNVLLIREEKEDVS